MFEIHEILRATRGRLVGSGSCLKVTGVSIDSRTIKAGEAFIAIKGENFDGHDFIDQALSKGAKAIITQYAVGNTQCANKSAFIQVKDTLKALGDIARSRRHKYDIPVIAVTGSNGKTTVKEMIAWVLSEKFNVLKNEGTKNNHIGLPLTLLNLSDGHDMAVLELGTNHFGEIDYLSRICEPNVGVITNIGPAHLEHFGSPKGVMKEKFSLVKGLRVPRIAILNADDLMLKAELLKRKQRPFTIGFGIKRRSDFCASNIKYLEDSIEFLVKYKFKLNTIGLHNVYNALAALAAGRVFGLTNEEISRRLKTFVFPQGRLKFINLNTVKLIDDSYNANPASLKAALETFARLHTDGRKIFVMGDMLELGRTGNLFHRQIGRYAIGRCDVFIAVGKLAGLSAQVLATSGFDLKNIFTCDTSVEAGNILFERLLLKSDDIVLVKGSRAMKMEELFKESRGKI